MSYILGNYGRFDFEPVRGKGSFVEDVNGDQYLDYASGIAVSSVGHAHPAMVEAVTSQTKELIHCSNLYKIPQQEELAHYLVEKVVKREGKCFFCNSGAEANEALLKLARASGRKDIASPRSKIITFNNSFHGRTFGGISATAQSKIQNGFGALLPDFVHLPYNSIESLEEELDKTTAAVLLEVVQGEGGVNVATSEFLIYLSKKCREIGALLMVDEVQAGFGRTGDLLSWDSILGEENKGLFQPHAISWAKGLGGGFPVGAIWISDEKLPYLNSAEKVTSVLGPGSHGTTFGGSPLASTVALSVLSVIEKDKLAQNAKNLGNHIKNRIKELKLDPIKEIKGTGLFIGIQLDEDILDLNDEFKNSGDTPSIWVVKKMMQEKVLLVPAGRDVVRILPPLNTSKEEYEILEKALLRVFLS